MLRVGDGRCDPIVWSLYPAILGNSSTGETQVPSKARTSATAFSVGTHKVASAIATAARPDATVSKQ